MQDFAHSIVETVRHPLVILDSQLAIIAANPVFNRLFNCGSPAEGKSLFALMDGLADRAAFETALREVISHERDLEAMEIIYHSPVFGRRMMAANARRVTRDEGGPPVIFLTLTDETEQRALREALRHMNRDLERRVADQTRELKSAISELRNANQELEAVNRELEAFCYSVSHDLRSPLRAVSGFSQELFQKYQSRLDDQGQHYITRILAGTERMGRLIDDLLILSRITRSELRLEQVDLSALTAKVADELLHLAPQRNVRLMIQPGLTALCDPRLTTIALKNLLENAWKFTSRRADAEIAFGQREAEGQPVFFVRDNGVGFDMAYAGKLFGAFQRLHSDRDFSGTGIGLATVQRVIHRHGGRIWAEAVLNQGATFFFTLSSKEQFSETQDRATG